MHDAILFDLDGTLVDTESVALDTARAAFGQHGHPVPPGFLEGLIGRDDPTAEALTRAAFPGIDLAAVNRTHRAAFQAQIAAGLPLKPGAAALLGRLDLPLAIVTSSRRASAAQKLALAGIAGHFTEVVVLEDVIAPKPAPEAYLLAAARLGVAPNRCLAFEDSEPGAEAAHRAGCTVVQVPDILPSQGRWAHHLAPDLLTGARLAGLIGPEV
jgi:HAD superfamily hydrolase (TIGR01509 family)